MPESPEVVVASAPGRVNLIGEHLDYNGGRCLPIAIDSRTTATVARARAPRFDSDHAGGGKYVAGVLAALGVDEPLAVQVASDVPVGAGLSSSAALTCSVALAVDALLGLGHDGEQLLAAAIGAENDHVGVPTGGMDQAVALFGGAGQALLLDFADGSRTSVPWQPEADGVRLLVVDTHVRHQLADGAYAERQATCEAAAGSLAPVALVDAGDDLLARLPALERRRVRHVVGEQRRVGDLVDAAAARDWDRVGALMTASHTSLRDDYEVSCPELDAVVETALGHGALGARMTGGGFGGSAIVLVAQGRVDDVRAGVLAEYARNGWEAPTVFPVEASPGARVESVT